MKQIFLRILVLVVISFGSYASLFAERDDCDFSTRYEVEISKKFFKRLEVGFTESLTLVDNSTEIEKISSKADVSYAIVRKIFKVGVSYYAIARNRDENYFFNQRFQGYTNLKYSVRRFSFAWRSRYQMSYRPEKEENKQWKNYWRNSISVGYKVPKIPLYPSVSAELFYRTNYYKGNVIDMMRYEAALKYEFNKKNALKLFYYYDDAFNVKNPQDVSTVGLAYEISL